MQAADPKVAEVLEHVRAKITAHGSAPDFRDTSNIEKQRRFVRSTFGWQRRLTNAQVDAVCARLAGDA